MRLRQGTLAPFIVVAACSSGAQESGITPVTGIVVRSETVTAGRGCGARDSEVFRYAAAIVDADGNAQGIGAFDCFADASFQNLRASQNGLFDYAIEVHAFNRTSYEEVRPQLENAALGGNLAEFRDIRPNWLTHCTARQRSEVETVANCVPLWTPWQLSGCAGATCLPKR